MNKRLLEDIAADVGTPTYVYDATRVREQYASLSTALADIPHRIHYSMKANSNLGILGVLHGLGAGVDIVSGGELHRALRAGFSGGDVVFSGVGKSSDELHDAVRYDVGLINVESSAELVALEAVVLEQDARASVGIRVNPEVTAKTHPYTLTGARGMKFGVPIDEVLSIARRISTNERLQLVGIGVHIGSQICDAQHFRAAAERLGTLIDQMRSEGIGSLERVDIGGGIGIRYRDELPMALGDFAAAIEPLAETGLHVVLEPGRFLVGDAGVLLTRCRYVKRSGGKTFVVVDGGMNDLVRPSWYQAEHEIRIVSAATERTPTSESTQGLVDVVGPLCEAGDFLGLERQLDPVKQGTLLAIHGAGAYGFAMSSNYNSRPRAAEVILDNDRWVVTRERESVEDLMRGERTLEEIGPASWSARADPTKGAVGGGLG